MSLVSIIIPSYNHAQWVPNAIESALNQSYEDIEVIVVDDGSTDNSRRAIEQFAEDPRVSVFFKDKNRGQGHSFNLGLSVARGKYVCFLPSDDWYLPDKTRLQVELFERLPEKVGVVYGRGQNYMTDTGTTTDVALPMHRGNVLRTLVCNGNFIFPATPLFRSSVFNNLSYDESYRAEGESIYVKVAEKFEFDYVEDIVAVMRTHGYNTGHAFEMMYKDNVRWWTEYFQRADVPESVAGLRDQVLGRMHRMYGLSILTELNKLSVGRSALLAAIHHNFAYLLDFKVLGAIALTYVPARISVPIFNAKRKGGTVA